MGDKPFAGVRQMEHGEAAVEFCGMAMHGQTLPGAIGKAEAINKAVQARVDFEMAKHACICGQWTLRADGMTIKCDGCGNAFLPEYEIDNRADKAVKEAVAREREQAAAILKDHWGGIVDGSYMLSEVMAEIRSRPNPSSETGKGEGG